MKFYVDINIYIYIYNIIIFEQLIFLINKRF